MFLTNDLMPLSVLDSVNFQALFERLNPQYSLPSKKHLTTKLLHQKGMDIQARIENAFHKAESVCLTIDLWSSGQMKGLIEITGYYIEDWTLKSVLLACSRFHVWYTLLKTLLCNMKKPLLALISQRMYQILSLTICQT